MSKKINPKKNKKSKKFKNNKHNIIFIQHNIGQVEYEFDKLLYSNNKNPLLIKNKKYSLSPLRDFPHYFYYNEKNKIVDIFFLQEVQYGNKNFLNFDHKYFVNYIITGHINISDENEKQNKVSKIKHGCIIAFNQDKYNFIDGIYSTNLNNNNFNKRYRTTDWIIIEEKITTNKYALLSVHGIICSEYNNEKLELLNKFYSNIIYSIIEIKKKYKKVNFIICGDFNINLLNPNFNPFNKVLDKTEKLILKEYENVIINFIKNLNNNKIFIYENTDETAFGKDFKEKLDFVLLSDSLIKVLNFNIEKYFNINKLMKLGDLEY